MGEKKKKSYTQMSNNILKKILKKIVLTYLSLQMIKLFCKPFKCQNIIWDNLDRRIIGA